MADKPRYYLTTAIAYPNGPPHIGHAYEAIATDAIARFMRLDGYDVLFVTGWPAPRAAPKRRRATSENRSDSPFAKSFKTA